ncbi:MAG: TIM barrel protein, partial [Calditrichia bacterium]
AFDRIIGIKRLKAIHLNDSKKPLGSRVDRHERVGKGLIGKEGISAVINDSRLISIPMILEIPGGNEAYAADLKLLRQWLI